MNLRCSLTHKYDRWCWVKWSLFFGGENSNEQMENWQTRSFSWILRYRFDSDVSGKYRFPSCSLLQLRRSFATALSLFVLLQISTYLKAHHILCPADRGKQFGPLETTQKNKWQNLTLRISLARHGSCSLVGDSDKLGLSRPVAIQMIHTKLLFHKIPNRLNIVHVVRPPLYTSSM